MGRRQRRRPRLLPGARRRRRCARRWSPRPRSCSPTSSATGWSTTPGRRCSPAPPPSSDFLALADGFTGETDVSVWRRLLAGLDQVDRLVDGDRRGRRSRPASEPWSAPALERLGWDERAATTPTATASCAARSSVPSPTSAPTPTRGRGCASSSSATAPTPPASRPTWPRRWCGPPRPRPAPTRSTRSSSGSGTATPRRRSSGSSTRSPRCATRSRWPGCSSWP